jgi:hypothetical protein
MHGGPSGLFSVPLDERRTAPFEWCGAQRGHSACWAVHLVCTGLVQFVARAAGGLALRWRWSCSPIWRAR